MSDHRTAFNVAEPMQAFVHRQVETGRYASQDEVIEAGLRMLEQHEAERAALHEELRIGLESGPAEPFDFDEFLDEMHAQHLRR